MLTDESTVSFKDLLDMYDEADPHAWDPDGGTTGTGDDPAFEMEDAADTIGIGSEYDNQKNNGVYD